MPNFKGIIYLLTALLAVFLFVNPVDARQGCCSHHDGVCGCSCCDGTPLSSTCLPYYPECSGGGSTQQTPISSTIQSNPDTQNTEIIYPAWTPYPTVTHHPTSTPKPSRTPTPTVTPSPTITPTITSTFEVTPISDNPLPTITITINLLVPTKTQESGIGGILSGFFRGIFNLLTLNLFTNTVPTPTPSPSPIPTDAPTPTITSTPTIVITIGVRTKTSDCKVNNGLPDRACTPGAIFEGITEKEVCVSGYTKKVRNVPTSEKNQVFAEYGITNHSGQDYEIDHLISLELGGNNDIANLFPEGAEPRPGYHEKDKLENYLHSKVCSGQLALKEAQLVIATDWIKYYKEAYGDK